MDDPVITGPSPEASPGEAPTGTPAGPRGRRPLLTRPLVLAGSISVLAAVSLLAGSGWLRRSPLPGTAVDGELTYRVVRGALTISFTEKGSIKAARSEQIFSTLEGMSTIVNVVPEGTFVKQGNVLVELDSSELTQLYNQQSIAVETAKAALEQADEAVGIQRSQNETDIKAAELAVELASIDRKKYQEGDYPLSVQKATADIHIAQEELKRAQNKYAWTKKLAEKGYVTGTELIADSLAVEKADVQAKQAKGTREVLEKYTHEKDKRKVESDYEQAERAKKRTQLKADSQLAQGLADQRGKKSTHDLSLRRLEKIKDQIGKTKILAPQDGMVIYHQEGRYGRDDRIIEQGATVRENQHLIDLPDLSILAVGVQVPEARIHQVEVGLMATVTIDAQNELVLRGRVTKIGILPDYVNRWMNPDLKVYQTEVTIDSDQELKLLRPGMSAKVEILVDQLQDALFAPLQSVTTVDGAPVCFVLRQGSFVSQSVEVGPSNESFIVIRVGLGEGDLIQLNAPRPRGAPPKKEKEPKDEEIGGPEGGFPAAAAFKGGPEGGGDQKKRGEGRRKGGGKEGWKRSRGKDGGPGGGPVGAPGAGGGKTAPAEAPPAPATAAATSP